MAYEPPVLEAIRRAVRTYPNKAELLRKTGQLLPKPLTKPALYDFINGSKPKVETLNAICSVLDLDPNTGMSKGGSEQNVSNSQSSKTIIGNIIRNPNVPPVLGQQLHELPPSINLTEEEARMILARRNTSDAYHVFDVIRKEIEMGWVYLPQGDQAAHLCLKAIKARLEDFETLREYHNELLKLKKQQRQK